MMPPPIIAPATPRPTRSSSTSSSSGSGEPHRLRSQADAERRQERADHDHAARRRHDRRRRRRRSPSGPGVCFHHADIRHACDASAAARPGRSLIGRTREIPEQRARGGDRRGRKRRRRRGRAAAPRRAATAALRKTAEHEYRQTIATRPASSDSTASAFASIIDGGASTAEARRSPSRSFRARCRRDNRADADDASATSKSRTPSAKLTESMSSSEGARNGSVREREDQRQRRPSERACRATVTTPGAGAAPRSGCRGDSPAGRG